MTFVATASGAVAARCDDPVRRRRPGHRPDRPGRRRRARRRPHPRGRRRRLRRPPVRLRRAAGVRRPGGRAHAGRRRALRRRLATAAGRWATSPTSPRSRSSRRRTSRPAEGGAVSAKDPALVQRAREFHNIGLVRDPDRLRGPRPGRLAPGGARVRPELPAHRPRVRPGPEPARAGCRRSPRRRAEIKARYDDALAGVDGVRTPSATARRRPGLAPVPGADPGRPATRGVRADAGVRHRGAGQLPPGVLASRSTRTSATAAACARTPRRSTSRSCRCRCSRPSPTTRSTSSSTP